MLRAEVARVLGGVLAAAAAVVAIVSYLTPFIGVPYAIVAVVALVVVATIVVVTATPARAPSGKKETQSRPLATWSSEEMTIVSRSYDVDSDKPVSIELPVHRRDYVFGRIEEEDRQYFSWYIVDTANLRKFDRGDDFNCQDGEDNVTAAALEWTVPRDAAWYLIIDVSMKQYVRRVTVNLKRRSKPPIDQGR